MNLAAAITVIAGALMAAVMILLYPWLRQFWRRRSDLSADQRRLLRRLPWYRQLDSRQRNKLISRTAELLTEVRFVGCEGVDITDNMRLLIAAQASLLCLGAQPGHFALPGEILVYPEAFLIHHAFPDEYGLIDDLPTLAAGEAWQNGRVILSWADVTAALAGAHHNVVLHEFAHLLDFAAPQAEGAPPMSDFDSWSAAFGAAFETLRRDGSSVIDVYGAENPAEFFAVAVEAFFQRGGALARAHTELYQVMAAYFDIDTARQKPRFMAVS